MAEEASGTLGKPIDTGLLAFVCLLRFLGKPADTAQLRHQFAPDGELFDKAHVLRAAKRLEVKARIDRVATGRLDKAVLPAIAVLKDGTFAVLARVAADRVLLHDASTNQPVIEQRAAFEARWAGELILLTTRERMVGASRPFDLSWFIPSIVRFRGLLGEALVGSLFLQLFALMAPLFTQVVIDKVLIHKGWSTLDVLVFGLVAISIFEILLGGLRAYVLAHTTNRIDVELGSRLFDHLMRLPLGYFETRAAGQTVARMRELETIRAFLTECVAGDLAPAFAVIRRKNHFLTTDHRPLNFPLDMKTINSKTVEPVLEFAHALYFFDRAYFFEHGRYWDWQTVRLLEIADPRELIDIDTEADFEFAEALWRGTGGSFGASRHQGGRGQQA